MDSDDLDRLWRETLPGLMKAIKMDVFRRSEAVLRERGLNRAQVMYIAILHKGGGMTLKRITDALGVDRAHTTRTISFLKEKGLVRDDRRSENQRKYNVSLTEEGEEVGRLLEAVIREAHESYLRGVTADEAAAIFSVAEKIRANIESDPRFGGRGCGCERDPR
ncbi:MAG: MarR family transcriptional regulator [Candidatus Methanoplasma sp.]|jgi:DNA-binding MarR family transcriptional regulator|nr:MarR family transcriptional regulator [Candidatus Methanoplasma sp.]